MTSKGTENGRGGVANVVVHNIQTLLQRREQFDRNRSVQDKIADSITKFFGSTWFAYLHVIWFILWIVINVGWTSLAPFDPYPFGLLTMVVSLEAIFLSTFVLISQNRMEEQSNRRAELDLQINLLTEHEVTKILRLTDALADHFHLREGRDKELSELEQETDPSGILQSIEEVERRK